MGNKGLHNTMEPAVFNIPVIIGKNYQNFRKVKDLVELGGILSVKSSEDFNKKIDSFVFYFSMYIISCHL